MLQFQPYWQPASILPTSRPRVLAQAVTPSPKRSAGVVAVASLISLAMGGAAAWVGFDTGARRKGLLSVLGYVVGVGGALSAVMDFAMLGIMGYRVVTQKPALPDAQTNLPLM
jgi:hypothetical protein